MIDLTKKSLPNTVNVGGRDFSIYTDFRLWMKFEIAVRKMKRTDSIDISYLFKNEMPEHCDLTELFSFSRPKNVLPKGEPCEAIIYDYDIDSDYIYSAFLGQYGIDLVDIKELHWHKFLALFNGLNGSTMMHEIMSYRAYKKDTRKDVDHYAELRDAWAIEPPLSEEEQQEIDEFNKAFGG